MNPVLKIILYVVLAVAAVVFGQRFFAAYANRVETAGAKFDGPETSVPADTQTPPEAASAATNETSVTPADSLPSAGTNALASQTNLPATLATNLTPDSTTNQAQTPVVPPASQAGRPSRSALGLFAFLTLLAVIGLALLVAHDVAHMVATRTHRELYNEEGEGAGDPQYDEAEQLWANGEFLEAIRVMRESLAKHPRRVHLSIRIAEIYEKDLDNHLAAALEYEEVLKHKLEAERWGWLAIHLVNLYNRMSQPEKAEALLQRLVVEYGQTAAARKARERLGLAEGELPGAPPPAEEPEYETDAGLKLPRGFKPRKR